MSDQIFVIYHGNCPDGIGAGYAAYQVFGDNATYYEWKYNRNEWEFPPGSTTYWLDCSPLRKEYYHEHLMQKGIKVYIIDHHRTTAERYADEDDGGKFTFNMDKSGAVLAWEHFIPDEPVPKLYKYIQDNDLWLHEFEETKFIHHVFNSYHKLDFPLVEEMIKRCHNDFDALIAEGKVIVRYRTKLINDLLPTSRWQFVGGHKIPTINTNFFFTNDVCHALCKLPKAPFGGTYSTDSKGDTKWSLRSDAEGNNFDVATVAQQYGGGGHRNASAFVIKKGETLN